MPCFYGHAHSGHLWGTVYRQFPFLSGPWLVCQHVYRDLGTRREQGPAGQDEPDDRSLGHPRLSWNPKALGPLPSHQSGVFRALPLSLSPLFLCIPLRSKCTQWNLMRVYLCQSLF